MSQHATLGDAAIDEVGKGNYEGDSTAATGAGQGFSNTLEHFGSSHGLIALLI